MALFIMGCGRCDPASQAAPALVPEVNLTAPTASAPERALCARVRGDNTLEMARAAYGDLLVLRYAAQFRDHDDVAKRARKAGAERAEPMIAGEAHVLTKAGLVTRTTAGLTAPVLDGMAGFLAAGRLPQKGPPIEVVLSTEDAQRLGLALGSEMTLAAPGAATTAPLRERRGVLVGTFAASRLFGGDRSVIWLTFAGARELHPEYQNGAATSLGVYLPKGVEATAFRDLLVGDLGPAFRVMTDAELQGPLVRSRADLLALCTDAPRASGEAAAMPPEAVVTPCGVRADEAEALSRATHGDASLVVEPNDGVTLESQPSLPAADRRWGVASSGLLATESSALGVDVAGLDEATLKALEGQVAAGSLDGLAAGGVAISDVTAKILGVGVKSEILLAARLLSPNPTLQALRTRVLRVEALLSYPLPSLSGHVSLVIMHRDQAASLHPELGKGRGNVVTLWAAPSERDALREALAVAPPGTYGAELGTDVEVTARETIRVLEALCPQ
jgi:hypothetical protein